MRAAVYYNNHDVRTEEMPVPDIGPGEILVEVIASGICGSDVLEWYRIKKAPIVLGHEITGKILKVGKDVKQYKPGQRVFVSHHVPCDECHYCRTGHHTACETLHSTNFFPGGFAEYVRVPEINVKKGTFILPKEISFEEGTFIEPLACVIRGQKIAGIKPGQTVLILGSGISGLLHLMLAKANRAGKVITTDISEYKLNFAKRLRADAAINGKADIIEELKKINSGRLADLVIVCTGAFTAFTQALECVERGGTVLFFACTGPDEKLPVPVNEFWRKEIKLVTSYANSPCDATEAIELLRKKMIPVEKLVTHRFNLEEAGEGFRLMTESKDSMKIIIKTQKGEGNG